MYIYSGTCRKCECGMPTGSKDMNGKALSTGDIVITYTEQHESIHLGSLTAIICNQYQTDSGGKDGREHRLNKDQGKFFAMGIYDSGLDSNNWNILKVKDFSDVIDGEKWNEFGFNYSKS